MGFFDFLGDVVKSVVDSAEQQSRNSGGSAISSGRMRETDKVKGAGSSIPHDPGVYRHRNKATGKVEYAGQTNDLRTRQQQHVRNGKLNTDEQYVQYSAAKSGASKADLCKTEVDHIARHKPSGNTTKGGNGRR